MILIYNDKFIKSGLIPQTHILCQLFLRIFMSNLEKYKQIRIPKEFAEIVEIEAIDKCRTISQQIMHWAKMGRNYELKINEKVAQL